MKTLLLDALQCRNKSRPPIWLMRQAGRYMPEYRALRAKHSFLEMCHQPELIAEITQLPIRAFGMDAAILFSDILVIPEALGVGLRFEDGVGPIIERPLNSAQDVAKLLSIDMHDRLNYVVDGIRLLKPTLNVPLIGFCGAPFTMASYMIEGGSSRDLRKTKQWMLSDPTSFHQLMDHLAECAIASLEMQIDAGVQAVQIFESWAGMLACAQLREFSFAYLDKIVKRIGTKVPVILFCRGASSLIPETIKMNPQGISIDWNADLAAVRQIVPPTMAIQGNLDPHVLCAPLHVVRKEAKRLLEEMRGHPGYIFNLGHGITPDVPVDAVKTLIECVQNH